MELKKIIFFWIVFCFLSAPAFGEEEKARLDHFLASQERRNPIQGKAIHRKLGADSKRRVLTKTLSTRPPKSFKAKSEAPQRVIQGALGSKEGYPKISGRPLVGRKTHLPRKSRFAPDLIKQPLQAGK